MDFLDLNLDLDKNTSEKESSLRLKTVIYIIHKGFVCFFFCVFCHVVLQRWPSEALNH